MDITYLDHSGFAVVTSESVLVFDYYKDPAHALDRILEKKPGLPVVFFVSHHHADHFNPVIFSMAQNHRRTYIISNDVNDFHFPDKAEIAGVSPGDIINGLPGKISVKAYGSTDAGVSFLVRTDDGHTIFHAGDLNYWHWQDESTPEEVRKAYNDFSRILFRIQQEVPAIDVLFFPVDPRQGTDYESGARLFMANIPCTYFFPMHFQKEAAKACDFDQYTPDNTVAVCLCKPGESKTLSL